MTTNPLDPDTAFSSSHGTPLQGVTVLDYWRWGFSEIWGNTDRGVLAEFIVARAIGAASETSSGWDPFDVRAPWGARVEVKTSGYVQRWLQRAPSRISWSIRKTFEWSDEAGDWVDGPQTRHSEVYVFCLLHERDRARFDPLDLAQWSFFVVPTPVIDQEFGEAKSLGLAAVSRLASPVGVGELRDVIFAASPA